MVILATFSAFLYVRLAQNLRDETDRALALEAQQIGSTLEMDHGGPFLSRALEQLPAGIVVVLYSPKRSTARGECPGSTDTSASAPQRKPAADIRQFDHRISSGR